MVPDCHVWGVFVLIKMLHRRGELQQLTRWVGAAPLPPLTWPGKIIISRVHLLTDAAWMLPVAAGAHTYVDLHTCGPSCCGCPGVPLGDNEAATGR